MGRLPPDAGLLIVGHGTRDRVGAAEFLSLVDQVRLRLPDTPVQSCFLEFRAPDIEQGFEQLLDQAVREVLVAPLFLFAAGHVRKDIPAAIDRVVARHGALRVRQLSHLGCLPRIVRLSARRYEEAVAQKPPVVPEEACLLLVGRGSRDRLATEEMEEFARQRRASTAVGRVEICYAAMQRPSLAEGLAHVSALPVRRIVVQPHLLFIGYLTTMIQASVDRMRDGQPTREWIVTAPLGPDPLLAEAVVEIATLNQARSVRVK